MDSVAIIMSTYNGEKYIYEQLESLRHQTYKNIDVYIHDDGSSDKTIDIIKAFITENGLSTYYLLNDEKKGYPACFINTLLKIPQHDYYAFCDQDDIWYEDKIEKAVAGIKKYEKKQKPCLFYSAVDYYDGNLNYMRSARFINTKKNKVDVYSLNEMLLGGEAMGMTFLFNNILREKMRFVYKNNGCDFKDTFMKIYTAACGTVVYSYEPCAKYRRHSEATTVGMNPATKISRLLNMSKKIFIERDGMASIQDSVNYIKLYLFNDVTIPNRKLINCFSQPNSIRKKLNKIFWRKRFRLILADEIGYRFAFLLGRI